MAPKKGQKYSGQFKPGNVANPFGRPKTSNDEKAARKMMHEKLQYWVGIAQDMTEAQYKELTAQDLPLGARAILDAYHKRNYQAIKMYEDRAAGKAREQIEVSGKDGDSIKVDYQTTLINRLAGK